MPGSGGDDCGGGGEASVTEMEEGAAAGWGEGDGVRLRGSLSLFEVGG